MIAAECPLLAGGGHRHNDGWLAAQALHGGGQAHSGTFQKLLPVWSWSWGSWGPCCCFPDWRAGGSCWWSSPCRGFCDAAAATARADSVPVNLVTEQGEEAGHAGPSTTFLERNIKCGIVHWFFLLWFLFGFYNLDRGRGLGSFHDFFIFVFRFFLFLVTLITAALILFWYDKFIRRVFIIKYFFLPHSTSG